MSQQTEYQVIARKYRPNRFSDVVGQDPIVATLKGAMKKNRIAHAYLFCGGRGSGKTTLARLLAKALNCESLSDEFEPCNACTSCNQIAQGHALDVLEIDGASHRGIEDIRQINDTIGYAPTSGKYKIYLIDEVHMLTKEAFNALLKTLEEPPSKVKFFFATTEPHKVPATILSRCQRFNLNRIPTDKIVAKLTSIGADLQVKTDPKALELIAKLAEGSLRDAESLFDQVLSFDQNELTLTVVQQVLGLLPSEAIFALDEATASGDFKVAFSLAEEVFSSGKNLGFFLEELIVHYRTLLLLKIGASSSCQDPRFTKVLPLYTTATLLSIIDLLIEAANKLKFATSMRLSLEMVLIQIIQTRQRVPLETLVHKLEALEQKLKPKSNLTEDPTPKPSELPKKIAPQKNVAPVTPMQKPAPPKPSAPRAPSTPQEQSRRDTVMRFAAKELQGSLKTKS